MAYIVMYTTASCPYCLRAKELLHKKRVDFKEIRVDEHPEERENMRLLGGGFTVPQIFIDGKAIGGCDELHALNATGKLDALLTKK